MKPLDPRLLRYARGARTVLGLGGLLGIARTLAVIVWCWCIAQALTVLVLPFLLQKIGTEAGGAPGRVAESAAPTETLPLLLVAAAVAMVVRSLSGWGMDVLAARGALKVKAQLRDAALDAIDARSPEWLLAQPDTKTATSLGRGLDALDGYFSGYLPQLIMTVCATPLLVLAVLLADPVSGITVLIVFPVIPVFMVLIGLATRGVQQRQWSQLQYLSRSFLDVVEGLTTLKLFRREQRQAQRIKREASEYRSRTMQVLRVTFLSGFVLDLAGTFSIALVAVTVGTRLVTGEFPLALGLFVLLLLPEAFIPIRAVGAAFHSSTEGLVAAEEVFTIIEGGADAAVTRPVVDAAARLESRQEEHGIAFHDVEVQRESGSVGPISFRVQPGEVVALTGPSGVGKSTLIAALLGFVSPSAGELSRPQRIAWAGQRAGLMQGTVESNVALGDSTPDAELVRRALDTVGLDIEPSYLLGTQGAGLSGGQAQRVSIARALYRAWQHGSAPLVLDEPSSALDSESEATVARLMRDEARAGRAVLVISHREALVDAADREIRLQPALVSEGGAA